MTKSLLIVLALGGQSPYVLCTANVGEILSEHNSERGILKGDKLTQLMHNFCKEIDGEWLSDLDDFRYKMWPIYPSSRVELTI